ncbi:hypothetical protein BDU57DRAFT_558851 [Ampelomyces quisqualis]|uniref:Alpha/Beta hydrolase protein n=1 Tax=Ampelomyces quisqualis TaxID=50730 RepID=A0A6A5QEW8_AMPQU|nr:hypothetical protein BDU57DRAFT_558851 [Ampelomyces quisqualis]
MAHPYAPMGGSYDDRVVGIVADEFLKAGWIVGTFNFRGAHGSKARTSWSGRPELDDYISFAACFMHYMAYLRLHSLENVILASEQPLMPLQADLLGPPASPTVILGGYSYGSVILRHLPPVAAILQTFTNPITGSAHDEILMRARKLAEQSNRAWKNTSRSRERGTRSRTKSHEPKSSMTMGGEETTPEKRRASRDIRRSVDRGFTIEIGCRLRSLSHSHCRRKDESPQRSLDMTYAHPIAIPQIRYLLISPVTPLISTFTAPALIHKFWHKSTGDGKDSIGQHATLAVYGNQDMFTSAKRILYWSEQWKATSGSKPASVEVVEVAEAGHFWVEHGVEDQLRSTLRDWEIGVR